MNCKFCNAELEEENSVCPACGKDNAEAAPAEEEQEVTEAATVEAAAEEAEDAQVTSEETEGEESVLEEAEETVSEETGETVSEAEGEPAKSKKGKVVAAVIACVVLLLALAAAVWYGVNDGWVPKANDVLYKETYSVAAEEVTEKGDIVVATIGDKELTNTELQVFYWMQVYDFLNSYSGYASYMGLDYTQPLETQIMSDGKTWQQAFLEASLECWHWYQAVSLEAEESGMQLDESIRTQLDSLPESLEASAAEYGFASAEEMLQAEMGPGATIEAYMDYLELYYLYSQYYSTEYDKIVPTDEEIEAYFAEHEAEYAESGITKDSKTVDVRHILIYPNGGTMDESGYMTYTDDEWEVCRLTAQALLDEFLGGDTTEDNFAMLANENSDDGGSNTNGGLYTGVRQGEMVEAFDAWCFDDSRVPGDTGLVKTEYGYHVMYFVGSNADLWYSYAQNDLMTELGNQIVENAMEEHPLKVNFKKIVLGEVELAAQ